MLDTRSFRLVDDGRPVVDLCLDRFRSVAPLFSVDRPDCNATQRRAALVSSRTVRVDEYAMSASQVISIRRPVLEITLHKLHIHLPQILTPNYRISETDRVVRSTHR